MSFIIPVNKKNREFIPNLTQIVGISVAEILDEFVSVKIKWANDILINGRKICGILLESQSVGEKIKIVAGIGLNVNSLRLNSNNNFLATSLFDETEKIFDLDELSKKIVVKIIKNIKKLEKQGLSPFIEFLNEKLAYKGETKTIIDGERKISGVISGVGKFGELIMQTENGEEKFISGEIGFEK
jgi:BirA family biotin operon repressor/biotin-[acetyl-CoA-carboxylase] ligase